MQQSNEQTQEDDVCLQWQGGVMLGAGGDKSAMLQYLAPG